MSEELARQTRRSHSAKSKKRAGAKNTHPMRLAAFEQKKARLARRGEIRTLPREQLAAHAQTRTSTKRAPKKPIGHSRGTRNKQEGSEVAPGAGTLATERDCYPVPGNGEWCARRSTSGSDWDLGGEEEDGGDESKW
jgi:hypothetical protein